MKREYYWDEGFKRDLHKLTRRLQDHFYEVLEKFAEHPELHGIHFEKLKNVKYKIYSMRVTSSYRAILEYTNDRFVFTHISNHDEAYRDRDPRSVRLDETVSLMDLQDGDVQEIPTKSEKGKLLFGFISTDDLVKLGVPNDMIESVKSIDDLDKLEDMEEISGFVRSVLKSLVHGKSLSDALEYVREKRKEEKARYKKEFDEDNIAPIPDDINEYRQMIKYPLEDWRVFLDPNQEGIVTAYHNGSAKILGSAGTGKTVVAMHRAYHLVKNCTGNEKILFTMYNSYLPSEIKGNLHKLCTDDCYNKYELDGRIEVVNLDKWINDYLNKDNNGKLEIKYDDGVFRAKWRNAINSISSGMPKDAEIYPVLKEPQFYLDEWSLVVVPEEAFTRDKYFHTSEYVRKRKFSFINMDFSWRVIEAYMRSMGYATDEETGGGKGKVSQMDKHYAMYVCLNKLKEDPNAPKYKHIIVDECQDFGVTAYKIIRALVDKGENDIFLVGDPRQRIYGMRTSLRNCGIDIRGRASYSMKINYRTSMETKIAADSVISGISFGDMDDGTYISEDGCESMFSLAKPIIKEFKNRDEEISFVKKQIESIVGDKGHKKVNYSEICVCGRTNKIVNGIEGALKKRGIPVCVKEEKPLDQIHDQVVISTMHKVKGLEFRYMFVVSLNEGIVPDPSINDPGVTNRKSKEDLERSLLYVAMSRTQSYLYLSSYGTPSRFLKEIESSCKDMD